MSGLVAGCKDSAVGGTDDKGKLFTTGGNVDAVAGDAVFGDDVGVDIGCLLLGQARLLQSDLLCLLFGEYIRLTTAASKQGKQHRYQDQGNKKSFFHKITPKKIKDMLPL